MEKRRRAEGGGEGGGGTIAEGVAVYIRCDDTTHGRMPRMERGLEDTDRIWKRAEDSDRNGRW